MTKDTLHVQYYRDGKTYFIREEVIRHSLPQDLTQAEEYRLAFAADYIIDHSEHKLIKCRASLEQLLQSALNVVPFKQPSEKVVDSIMNLRDELLRRAEGEDSYAREIVFKLNSCLYKEYPHGS